MAIGAKQKYLFPRKYRLETTKNAFLAPQNHEKDALVSTPQQSFLPRPHACNTYGKWALPGATTNSQTTSG
jgi:hypothetical protein